MIAGFADLAVVEHDDTVRIADGGKPVCDDERGASVHQVQHRFLNVHFCACIYTGCRLVENQNFRVGEDGARNGKKLTLPVADVATGFGKLRIISLRHPLDKGVGVGGYGSPPYFLVGGIQSPIADIGAYGVSKEHRVLKDDGNIFPQ